MTNEQIAALAAMGNTTAKPESKTIDYKIAIANKKGDVKSVGILKVWKRFTPEQIAGIVALLGADDRTTIEELTGEAVASDDEF